MSINTAFVGKVIGSNDSELFYFKYPGGGILLEGTFIEIYGRFVDKGFKPEVIEEILLGLFGSVASEPSVTLKKIINS